MGGAGKSWVQRAVLTWDFSSRDKVVFILPLHPPPPHMRAVLFRTNHLVEGVHQGQLLPSCYSQAGSKLRCKYEVCSHLFEGRLKCLLQGFHKVISAG